MATLGEEVFFFSPFLEKNLVHLKNLVMGQVFEIFTTQIFDLVEF